MKEKKKKREPRAKKVKADFDTLPKAIVDGKLLLPLKALVFFERTLQGKVEVHEGEVLSFDKDLVTLWDETRGQKFSFELTAPVRIVAQDPKDIIKEECDEKVAKRPEAETASNDAG